MIRSLFMVGAAAVIWVGRQDHPGRAWVKQLLECKLVQRGNQDGDSATIKMRH